MTTPTTITQCPNCNGSLVFNPAAQTLDCPYCRSTYTLQGVRISSEAVIKEKATGIIPFSFAKEIFDKAAMEWLSQGEFTPADILDSFHSTASRGEYIPVYLWEIAYIHTSPMGNRTGQLTAIDFAKEQKKWPDYMLSSAKTFAVDHSLVKPFSTAYTLGFEMAPEDSIDSDDFKNAAKEFALAAAVDKEKLPDNKTVVITEMKLTKVYVPFWINKYIYQSERYQVIMSGNNSQRIDGSRPVDMAAFKAKNATFKWALRLLGISIGLFVLMMITIVKFGSGGSNFSVFISVASILAFAGFLIATVVAGIIAILRTIVHQDPTVTMAKTRAQRLAQRMQQRS